MVLADIFIQHDNLVPRARSEFNGIAGTGSELFGSTGVLDYWSVGKNESPSLT